MGAGAYGAVGEDTLRRCELPVSRSTRRSSPFSSNLYQLFNPAFYSLEPFLQLWCIFIHPTHIVVCRYSSHTLHTHVSKGQWVRERDETGARQGASWDESRSGFCSCRSSECRRTREISCGQSLKHPRRNWRLISTDLSSSQRCQTSGTAKRHWCKSYISHRGMFSLFASELCRIQVVGDQTLKHQRMCKS